MNYYSQHHHQVFLLLLVLILFSTLTFCCFLLICTDWREVMRLPPVNLCGINLSALPRLLINIFTPSPQTGIIAVSLSVVITSKTSSLNSAADTKDHNFPCFLDYLTQFSYPQSLFSTPWKKSFWSLSLILHWFQSNSQCRDAEHAQPGIFYCSEECLQNPFLPHSFRFKKPNLCSFMFFSRLPHCRPESDSPGRAVWLLLLDGQGLNTSIFQHLSF